VRDAHWQAVTAVAGGQLGLVATRQIDETGCPRRTRIRAVELGLLVPYRRGVYLVAGSPPSPYHPVLAACLATGPGTTGSHLAAVWLWDFDRVRPDHVEVKTLLGNTRRLAGVRTHMSGVMLGTDIDERHGVPVTSAARTAIDVAAYLSPYLLARFVDHLRRRHHLTTQDLATHLEILGGRGRAGTRNLRRIVAERLDGLEPGDTHAEVDLVQTLLSYGVRRPVQQHQVVAGRRVFVIDVAWPECKVGLELDGFDPHATDRTTFDGDKDRDLILRRAGWEINHVSTKTDLRMVADYLLERLSISE
jgi:very-short-patch-repair endonuclease